MTTPTQEYRRTAIREPKKLHKGLDATVDGMVGRLRRTAAVAADLLREADEIDRLGDTFAGLSDRHLKDRMEELRLGFARHRLMEERVLYLALAAIREAAERQTGMRPFKVQLAGALALHRGHLAEMATGEGKTLTASLAATLAGWTRRPCHVVTVNDYLAQRDAEWMKPLYHFCGVSAGYVTGAMDPVARRAGYAADVAYCTSKEIVADFLRDRLRLGRFRDPARRQLQHLLGPGRLDRLGLVMRGLYTAIVDEADSVLGDEAVTPVIISAHYPNPALKEACLVARDVADSLVPGVHYQILDRYREVEMLDAADSELEPHGQRMPGLWRGPSRRRELIRQALTAREFFHEGRQYVVDAGKVVIVDEYTGRAMPQRTWREGLHQAVEAKAGLEITDPSETLARLSFQRFFRLFTKLSGMTGTAWEAADEFWHIYHLAVVQIPTNRPCVRKEMPDRIFPDREAKWQAVVSDVASLHATGRPILVGTRSIDVSELLSNRLTGMGLEHQVLNAVRHQEEARIVAEAGLRGRITIATNMAGRGTDIKLGKGIAEIGGLHVIATERHESRRIDRQLFGRCARQGDPGSVQAYVSGEDELLKRFVPRWLRLQLVSTLRKNPRQGERLAGIVFGYAQWSAQRMAFRQRRNVLGTDTWIEDSLSFAGSE
jgi:preprotein translocase subunit SecA